MRRSHAALLLGLAYVAGLEDAEKTRPTRTLPMDREGSTDPSTVRGKFLVTLCDESRRRRTERHIVSRHADPAAPRFSARVKRHFPHIRGLPSFVVHDVRTLLMRPPLVSLPSDQVSHEAVDELRSMSDVCAVTPILRRWALGVPDSSVKPVGEWWHLDRTHQKQCLLLAPSIGVK